MPKYSKQIVLAIATALVAGCGTGVISVETYSERPITAACALEAIENIPIIQRVSSNDSAVIFAGEGFRGELFHGGGDSAFINYGINVESNSLFGPKPAEVVDSIAVAVKRECEK